MAEEPASWHPEETDSFSVAAALRAPVGVTLPADRQRDLRRAAVAMLAGLVLIVVDVMVVFTSTSVDVVPDLVGGLAIVHGARLVGRVAAEVGPARAASRAQVLALLQLPLLAAMTVVPADLGGTMDVAWRWATPVQTVIGCTGTAIVGTVFGRAHDSLGQYARRGRWALARRVCLVSAVAWFPMAWIASADQPSGLHGFVVGLTGVIVIVLAALALVAVLRALSGSTNVLLPDR